MLSQRGQCYKFEILSRSGSVKKFEFLHPFSKATEKTERNFMFCYGSAVLPFKFKCWQLLAGFWDYSLHHLLINLLFSSNLIKGRKTRPSSNFPWPNETQADVLKCHSYAPDRWNHPAIYLHALQPPKQSVLKNFNVL